MKDLRKLELMEIIWRLVQEARLEAGMMEVSVAEVKEVVFNTIRR